MPRNMIIQVKMCIKKARTEVLSVRKKGCGIKDMGCGLHTEANWISCDYMIACFCSFGKSEKALLLSIVLQF